MFNKTELASIGMLSATVRHPRTGTEFVADFYVTERDGPILGIDGCRQLDLLRIVDENICEVQEATPPPPPSTPPGSAGSDILSRYADVFDGKLGLLAGDVHLETDPQVRPVQMPLRRLPVATKDRVQQELDRMVREDIIAPVTQPTRWVSALLVVSKPNGGIRICLDPKPLNKALQRSQYYMPTLDDILPQLSQVKVFSTVDVKDAFHHLKLDEPSSFLTTFETPFGRYRWKRMCFGINVAPEVFQARIHAALAGLNGIYCIADDILVTGSGSTAMEAQRDHDRNLEALLQRCRQTGLKLNKLKVKLNRQSVVFMGHELTAQGLRPSTTKIEAIDKMPVPGDEAAVHRFLGFATYLARYCPHFSEHTTVLRELLKKENEFRWEDRHQRAFEQLKRMIMTPPVLRYFDPTAPLILECDASQSGLGAALIQQGKVVEFASRAMSSAEQNYAQIEKELLSIIYSLSRWDVYTYGRPVVVHTDHKPLLAIHQKALASAPKRLQRMLLRLQRYNVKLIYRPGTELILADTLSRRVPPTAPYRPTSTKKSRRWMTNRWLTSV
jgi:RNase H-like domain found in reverse transcriptase/Reverse transcriptase (RNA-dependent DNA polymerase)